MDTAAQADASLTIKEPILQPRLPLVSRVSCAVGLWLFKSFVSTALGALRIVKASDMKKSGPTYTKRYDIRPMLEHRVFVPSSYQAGSKLPLYLDIHGGGFAICDPQTDDKFCRFFADKYGYCVVSLDYRKAPTSPFPVAVHDLAEVAKAVLADPDLPVDRSQVVGGGFSAGGNLILAISQMDGLREKFRGIIPIYPVVDFSSVFKGEYRTTPDGKPDMLRYMSPLFNWGYIPLGQERTDPLLSPIYAPRKTLPQKVFLVGAQHDYLCHEAFMMAKKLTGSEDDASVVESKPFAKDGIKWRMVEGVRHGFTHTETSGEAEERRVAITEKTYAEMAQWLNEEVLV